MIPARALIEGGSHVEEFDPFSFSLNLGKVERVRAERWNRNRTAYLLKFGHPSWRFILHLYETKSIEV